MTDQPGAIDRAVYAELEAAAGADFARELVGTFLEEAPAMRAALRSAHAAGDAAAFRRAAHLLKSNGLTFGALALGARARELELGGLPADAAPLDALDTAFAHAAAALERLRDA